MGLCRLNSLTESSPQWTCRLDDGVPLIDMFGVGRAGVVVIEEEVEGAGAMRLLLTCVEAGSRSSGVTGTLVSGVSACVSCVRFRFGAF